MAPKRGPKKETLERAERFARIIANGGRRSDCIRYAQDNWGVKADACDLYLQLCTRTAERLIGTLNARKWSLTYSRSVPLCNKRPGKKVNIT